MKSEFDSRLSDMKSKIILIVFIIIGVLIAGRVFVFVRHKIAERRGQETVFEPGAEKSEKPKPAEPASVPGGGGTGAQLGLLGGQSSFCTEVPFLMNGQDIGAKVAAYLGMYKDAATPQFGANGDAEVTTSSGEITIKFHPKNNYTSPIHPDFNGDYFLYVGLIPPWSQPGGKTFAGCGYNGAAKLLTGAKHLRFKGDFKWISGGSNPPTGSGAGNTLLGGWLAYRFADGRQDIVAINDFGTPIGVGNPTSLAEANYECSDWWHNLSWADWWRDDGRLNDVWYSFDIDVTAAHEKAVEVSGQKCRRDNSLNEAQTYVPGLFVGPEYGVGGGPTVFTLRNLRTEIR